MLSWVEGSTAYLGNSQLGGAVPVVAVWMQVTSLHYYVSGYWPPYRLLISAIVSPLALMPCFFYNARREFCFRARWKSSLAVSTAPSRRPCEPATLRSRRLTRCNSGANGYSPDGRGRCSRGGLHAAVARSRAARTDEACMEGIHTGSFSFWRGEGESAKRRRLAGRR